MQEKQREEGCSSSACKLPPSLPKPRVSLLGGSWWGCSGLREELAPGLERD